jgi:hypothetical protein
MEKKRQNQQVDFTDEAFAVLALLHENGAKRLDRNTIGGFMTVNEMCKALDFYRGDWTTIKERMLELGFFVCYKPGKGHYLGFKGETVMNVVYVSAIARSWNSRVRKYIQVIEHEGAELWAAENGIDYRGILNEFYEV